MSDIKTFCRTLGADIRAAYPRLDVYFAVKDAQNTYENAFDTIAHKLAMHPAGDKIYTAFENCDKNAPPSFLLAHHDTLLTRMNISYPQTCVVVFVSNTNAPSQDIHKTLQTLYSVLNTYLKKEKPLYPLLAGDIFSLMYQSLQDSPQVLSVYSNAIIDAIFNDVNKDPESCMFPVIHDLTRTMCEEKRLMRTVQSNHVANAFTLAQKIIRQADPVLYAKWQEFIALCRQMVLADHTPEAILGTAIFSCKDIHLRMAAYLAIERGSIEPATVTRFKFYNPFFDDDENKRTHEMMCKKTYETYHAYLKNDFAGQDIPIDTAIAEQNQKFTEGRFIGWCVPVLQMLERKSQDDCVSLKANQSFQNIFNLAPWKAVKMAGMSVLAMKKYGNPADPDDIPMIVKQSKQ